jgi:hypothetical protein
MLQLKAEERIVLIAVKAVNVVIIAEEVVKMSNDSGST